METIERQMYENSIDRRQMQKNGGIERSIEKQKQYNGGIERQIERETWEQKQ